MGLVLRVRKPTDEAVAYFELLLFQHALVLLHTRIYAPEARLENARKP